jgi:uncharacterized protein YcsI (UPF0317 family)
MHILSEDYESLRGLDKDQLRKAIRASLYEGHTAGLAAGFLQANIIILPEKYALDFMRFCQRNPKPCPLVGVSETGSPLMRTLGRDIDIRSDVPRYNIYRNGELSESTLNIFDHWADDSVAFALGCSFTFEDALVRAGIPIWHIEANKTVPMYRSNIETCAAGPFGGKTVVTMRVIDANRVDEAVEISRRYPMAHGGPLHIGDPSLIGLNDLSKPDWGDSPAALGDKIPVFWACGVTPQNAIMRAQLPIMISHTPGHMLITDIDDQAEVPVYVESV